MNQQQPTDRPPWQPHAGPPLPVGHDVPDDSAGDAWGGLGDLVLVLRLNRRGLLIWMLLCLGLTGVYLLRAVPEYVATTQIVLEPRRQVAGGSDANGANYGPALDSAQADSQVQVVKSERNLRFVFDTLNLGDDPVFASPPSGLISRVLGLFGAPAEIAAAPGQAERRSARAFQAFADRVSVRRIGQSYALEVAFRAPSGVQAARLANSVTAAYILDQIEFRAAAVQRGTEFLQGRIADIKAEQDVAIDSVKKGVIPDVQFADSDARIVSAATEPLSKAFPQPKLLLLLAMVFSVLSGVGFAAVRHSLDRKVLSRRQIGQALGIDCLAVLPRVQVRRGGRVERSELALTSILDTPDSDVAEALRVLRTGILSVGRASRHLTFGLVSWSPGEGRSAIAANLALLIAASRERVVLIDGDFRNPALSRSLAPNATSGLSERLLGHGAATGIEGVSLNPYLNFVPAVGGGQQADPNVFIGSTQMREFLLALRRDRDVIVDLAPLSLSSDAQAIGPSLDGVVLIVEVNRTKIDEVSEVVRALRSANTRLLGIILNKMPATSKSRRNNRVFASFARRDRLNMTES